MKIVDERYGRKEMTSYEVGQVICTYDNFYLIVREMNTAEYAMINLSDNAIAAKGDSLEKLFKKNHDEADFPVNATITITGAEHEN
ncbi:hypothetical protein ACUIJQ_08335 [Levilactobacillus hammesii]|uniref:Uncharacterized protein n=1 Tax=Levilactobacillus hammesii DSM 16381 TaxID=1423753 RepID=A0A0R1UR48_9LACO|nr:hypothetical protein [Levilactobacillus hammesii]KRL95550.1 hypothetical protein FD28_GL002521 [Levilactobacillus hammesii DSM 16381]